MSGNAAYTHTDVIKERLGIEVTTQCNIHCLHCFVRARVSEPSSLSIKLAKQILAEGYSVGYHHFHITGGEPLLWEGLFDVLDYAFDIGYETGFLNTNGTLLTVDVSSRLATYNGLSISVSLEATETLHDHLRGEGSYRQAVQGIERVLVAGIDLIIFTIACKSLLSDLSIFAEDLYKKFPGIKYLTLIQFIPVGDGTFTLSEELLGPEDFLQLVGKVSLLNLFGLRTCFLNNPLAFVASKLLKILWIPASEPLYCKGSMIVMANRDICLSHFSTDTFGKYELGMIEKVLTSGLYRKAVMPDERTCPSCKYSEFCKENGMVHPLEFYWDAKPNILYCQEVLDNIRG